MGNLSENNDTYSSTILIGAVSSITNQELMLIVKDFSDNYL